MRTSLVASAVVFGFVLAAPAQSDDRYPSPTFGPGAGVYTYEQARARGIPTPPEPSELGLPTCHPDPNWRGFKSPEEATRAAEAASEQTACAADPRQALYMPSPPAAPTGPPELLGQ